MMNLQDIEWILAPMDGVTDYVYRNAWYGVFGAEANMHRAVAPFTALVQGKRIKRAVLKDLLPENNPTEMQVEPQVLGNDAEDFLTMNRALADEGYTQVNWNLGCPKPQVARKQRGSGLLPYPERIDAVLNEVCARSPIKISVKIRLGYANADEVYPVIEVLNRYPLAYTAVHPRIGKQLYTGEADLDKFAEILPQIKTPVIYNGDIDSPAKAEAFAQRFPQVKQIMIGRGVIQDPLLPCALNGTAPTPEERKAKFCKFAHALWDGNLQRQKLHWSQWRGAYVPAMPDGTSAFEYIKHMTRPDEYEKFLNEICPILN